MRKSNLLFGMMLLFCLGGAISCQEKKQGIEGTLGEVKATKMYLYKVMNEVLNYHSVIDSTEVVDNHFFFATDSLPSQMFYIATNEGLGGYVFWEPGNVKIKPEKVSQLGITWNVKGSELDKKYREYVAVERKETRQDEQDSLAILFYKKRDENNRQEMERLKNESLEIHDIGQEAYYTLYPKWVEKNADNLFGPYLYYSREFCNRSFRFLEIIENERKFLDTTFKGDALNSYYYKMMKTQLEEVSHTVIGAIPPEIEGTDPNGNPIKLSDFRGKYVIVDFWDSYCKYCRAETPNLKKALELYGKKGLTILGVSFDFKKEDWLNAIEEDGSTWNHMMLPKKNKVTEQYRIQGIPYIILLNPEGKIVEVDLRGGNIFQAPGNYLK